MLRLPSFLALAAILSFAGCGSPVEEAAVEHSHTVEVERAREQTIREKVESYGSVAVRSSVDVTAAVDGSVRRVAVEPGDRVEVGTPLVHLENVQLSVRHRQAESDIEQSRSSVVLARARLDEARSAVERRVLALEKRAIEVELMRFEQGYLGEATARARQLKEIGGTSEEELRELEATAVRLRADYESLIKEIEIESLSYGNAAIRAAGAGVPEEDAQRVELLTEINTRTEQARLAVAKSAHESALAELESTELLQGELEIRSPRSGVVAARQVEQGERLREGDTVVSLFEEDPLHALISATEAQAAFLSAGLEARVTVVSLDERIYRGEVERVSPAVDRERGGVPVRILMENSDGALRPGLFVRATIYLGEERPALTIARSTLVRQEESEGTVVIVRGERAMHRDIELGALVPDERIEVRSGLSHDELLVDRPSALIEDGDALNE